MLTLQQFVTQIFAVRDIYRQDNAWVARWSGWDDDGRMSHWINEAYKLYSAAPRNALGMIPLGGTMIRQDKLYIQNFGLTGATGIQEKHVQKLVEDEEARRRKMMGGLSDKAPKSDRSIAPVTGSGSILSESSWTPILNDSLILGGIALGYEFHLALEHDEQLAWKAMNGPKEPKAGKVGALAAKFEQGTTTPVDAWREFFQSQKRMFIDENWNNPRVLSRELLGLSFFGYKPQFSWYQLSFVPSSGKMREQGTFPNYVRKLRETKFQENNLPSVMRTISEFLFNDPKALGSPWPTKKDGVKKDYSYMTKQAGSKF